MTDPNPTELPYSAADVAERLNLLEPDNVTWEDRAYELLRSMVRSGGPASEGMQDGNAWLTEVLQRAYARGGDDEVEEWLYRLERASTTTRVLRNGQYRRATLLTLPLVVIRGDASVRSALDQNPATVENVVGEVATNLRGLIRKEAELLTLPRIYTAEEVSELSYADVATLLDWGLQNRGAEAPRPSSALPVPERRATRGGVKPQPASPAFLVLVHIDDEQHAPFKPENTGLSRAAFLGRYREWAFDTGKLLREALGFDILAESLTLPLGFFEGYRVGTEGARGVQLFAEVAALCVQAESQGIDWEDVVAQFVIVSGEEARLGFRHLKTGMTLGTTVLPVFDWETPEVARDSIETLLYDQGLAWSGDIPADVSGPLDSIEGG